MKLKENHIVYNFKPMKLYYDDIEEIYNIFKEQKEDIKIEADQYELDKLSEIFTIKKNYFTNLKISIYNPYVSLEFSATSIRLYASDDTPLQRGIFEKLKACIIKKERFLLSKLLTYKAFFIYLFIMSSLSFWNDKYITLTLGIGGMISYFAVVYYSLKRYSEIIPLKRNEKLNIFQRNKDQIFSAIVGGLIVLLITKWLEK